jgi:nucleoside phosphorylase
MSAEYKPKSRKWWKELCGCLRAASPAPSNTLSTDIRSSDQGNTEHGLKAIVATESFAPPSPSAAAAKAAQPRTDTRVPDDHQPPAASQALPPALPAESAPKPPSTESTEQLTPVLSVSERLWNAAYDSLETDNADRGVAPDTNIPAELHNPTNRQTHVRRLVEEGQARIPRAPKITMRLAYGDYTIAWICALPLELAASRAMLDEQHLPHPGIAGDDNTYVLGRIHRHNVVMACLPGQYGTNNATIVATNLKRSFPSIRTTLMVGIAGRCPSQADLYLGDVVVGTKVIQYDMGKALGGGRFQETAIPKTPAPLLNSAVSTLQSTYMAHQASDRIAGLLRSRLPNLSRPDHLDRLFQASYEHHHLGAPTCDDYDPKKLQPRAGRRSNEPQIHYGVIASANRVMRNGKERDEIARRHSALCFEMEAAGIMDNVQYLPIRGICDYSDSHKDKVWQDYAATTAAAYARELLEVIPTIPTTHWDLISMQKDAYRDDVGAAYYRDLRVVDPQHDMERIEKSKDKLLDDAYKWILHTPEYEAFTNWDDSRSNRPPRRLLWIKGHAGMGKTILMIGLIRQLSHQPIALSPALSFFFYQGTDTALNNATAILRSLI